MFWTIHTTQVGSQFIITVPIYGLRSAPLSLPWLSSRFGACKIAIRKEQV